MQVQLTQEGRAGLDFAAEVTGTVRALRARVTDDLVSQGLGAEALPQDRGERDRRIGAALADSRSFRVSNLLSDWASTHHGRIAHGAFEQLRGELEPQLRELDTRGPATLDPVLGDRVPDYFRDVWFHRTTGGWDGHDFQGFVHAEFVHRNYVFRTYPGGIFEQRLQVLEQLPQDRYDRILDMGASSGHYTYALAQTFPEAQIHGCDLSIRMLEQARRVANEHGWAWKLHQVPAEDTGLASSSFDLVTSYILLHELPARIIRDIFAEAFRLLRPGGHLLMSDVVPLRAQDGLSQWWALHQARMGGEPYWEESASLDLAQVARAAGFVDARTQGLGPALYPWITYARKPPARA